MPLLPDLTNLLPSGMKPGSANAAGAKGEARPALTGKEAGAEGKRGLELAKISNQEKNPVQEKRALEKAQDQAEQMEQVKTRLNEELSRMDVGLEFQVNQDLDRVVVSVIQRETGKIIRQIPPEEMLELAKGLKEMSGVLVNTRS